MNDFHCLKILEKMKTNNSNGMLNLRVGFIPSNVKHIDSKSIFIVVRKFIVFTCRNKRRCHRLNTLIWSIYMNPEEAINSQSDCLYDKHVNDSLSAVFFRRTNENCTIYVSMNLHIDFSMQMSIEEWKKIFMKWVNEKFRNKISLQWIS